MKVREIEFILALLFSVSLLPMAAQTVAGSISGTVVEQSGAVIAGARVTATNVGQKVSQATTTDRNGSFVFPQLNPSTYALTVQAPGFKKVEQENVVLNANTNISVGKIELAVGATTETVEVYASGQQLQTDSAARGSTLVADQLQNVEVNGRSPLALLRLTPGVYTDRAFDINTNELGNIYADGSRGNQQNLTMNGITNTDYGANSRMMVTASLDSVQEMTILTSNYDAQYGKNAGAQISVVVKAGTHSFHGSAYEYYKDRGMNANGWYNNRNGTPRAAYHFNDPGYTIGGPVFIPGKFNTDKTKLFFFWSEEYQRQLLPRDQNGNSSFNLTVPTALERTGDFSQSVSNTGQPMNLLHDPLSSLPCTSANTSGCFQAGGVLGRIPATRLYSPGMALLHLFPLPNPKVNQLGYNYIFQPSGTVPRHEQILRMDYNINDKWKLWGSLMRTPQDIVSINASASGYSLSPNFPIANADFNHPGYLFNLNLTTLISSSMTNEVQGGASHHPTTIYPHDPQALSPSATGVTLPTAFAPLAGWIPDFTFNGSNLSNSPQMRYSGAGGAYSPFTSHQTVIDVTDNFTMLRGNHLFKAGLYFERNRKDQTGFAPTEGVYNWGNSTSNPLDTGFGFANAAVGVYTSFQQATNPINGQYRYTNLEFYGQDTWKITPRLTLVYGVRASWAQPWYDKGNRPSTFFPDKWNASQAPKLFWPGVSNGSNVALVGGPNGPVAIDPSTGQPYAKPSIVIGNIVPSSGSLTDGVFQAGNGVNKYMMQDQGVLLGPRIGLTFDLTGNGNVVWRAGLGRYFDRYQGNEIFNTVINPPAVFTPTYFNGFASNINSGSGTTLLGPSGLTILDYAGHLPTTYKFSTGFQAKLPFAIALDTSYVGALSRFLLGNLNLNAVPYGANFLPQNQNPQSVASNPNALLGSNALTGNFLRPYVGYAGITKQEFGLTSNYHALQITLDRRFVKGLFLGGAYTFSKCLDAGSNDGAGLRIDGLNHQANYGNCDFDVRQNLIINYVYPIPNLPRYAAFNSPALREIVDGWQLSGTTQFRSGLPFTPSVGSITVCNPATSTATTCSSLGQLGLNSNITGTPDYGPRIVIVGNPKKGTSSTPYNRINAAAFSAPLPGSLGLESRRNYLNTPGANDFDASLQKNLSITERVHMEFRVDAFNVFNHTQFSGVNSTLNYWVTSTITNGKVNSFSNITPVPTSLATNPNTGAINFGGFGAVNGIRPARILQLVTRVVF
jgi:hypothetical protein